VEETVIYAYVVIPSQHVGGKNPLELMADVLAYTRVFLHLFLSLAQLSAFSVCLKNYSNQTSSIGFVSCWRKKKVSFDV